MHGIGNNRVGRLALNHLLIDLAKAFHAKNRPYGGGPFGAEIGLTFVGACIAIGDLEHRRMTTSDIAAYLEMPRSSVQRKVDKLIERELVARDGNKYFMAPKAVAHGEDFVERINRVLLKTQPR